MGFAFTLAVRYLGSRKRRFISLSTLFSILGVALGSAALVAVMSVTGGFRAQFQKKVLGVNAHVMVLGSAFRDYRAVVERVREIPEVVGLEPFVLNAAMLTHAGRTATGVMLKGVEPEQVGKVLDLPEQIIAGSLEGLRPRAPSPPQPRAPAAPAAEQPRPSAAAQPQRSALLPPGSIVPPGGYQSELPSDDVALEAIEGDPCSPGAGAELPGIVLGVELAQTLRAGVGDCVQVASPSIGYSFAGRELRAAVARYFRVSGIFQAGFQQYDARFAYTNLAEAQALYQEGDSVTGVELKVSDVDQAREVQLRVEEVLQGKPYTVLDWMELNRGLFTALRIQQILMSLVLGLIILVAAFTVIATLIMVVLDKQREIAVIKAMGASDAQVLRAFVYQGLLIGLAGTALGLGGGYVVCRWILTHAIVLDPQVYFIDRLPVQLRPAEFVLTGAFALLACLLATMWPALHASRLRPADAFREA
jgi:lipoprotein-releasing system permease protein